MSLEWFIFSSCNERLSCSLIEMESVSNVNGKLCHYKTSLRGVVHDYIITFNSEECDIRCVTEKTYELFEKLIKHFQNSQSSIACRLVAKVNVIHVNEVTDEMMERSYFFPSFKTECIINDVLDFYTRHMLKIAERLEYFHANGSNFQLKNIESIHILLTLT